MSTDLSTTVLAPLRGTAGMRRLFLVVAVAGTIAAIVLLVRWAGRPALVTLYQGMELAEAGAIAERLAAAGVTYELQNGGTAIGVPATDAARARVLLASQGIDPSGGRPGLELFDRPAWGMTEFTQRVTYRRALEGELSRTISRLDGVERAQVHLVLPETSPLRRLNRPAEAAVVVTLLPGASLDPASVQGMAQLVASSVEYLTSENVAVLDGSGKLLSTPADAQGTVGLTSRQLEIQQAVEDHLARKVDDIVAQVVGGGEARVQVTALLNFEQVDRTIEAFDPDGQVIESEQRSEQPSGGATPATITNNRFQNSRRIDKIVGAVGGITRLTVAVLVNERALLESEQTGTGSVQVRLANLEALVRDAVGIDQARGDRLTIAAIPFEEEVVADLGATLTDTPPSGSILVTVERFARPGIALLGILAAFVLGWRMLKAVPQLAAATMQEALPAPQAASEPAQVAAPQPHPVASIPTPQADSAARVMRAWLAEPTA